MKIDNLIEVIKKHGATGVLAVWLLVTNARVTTLESQLYECYRSKMVENVLKKQQLVAILPEKIRIKYA